MQELTYQKLFSRIGACYFALLAGSQVLSAIVLTAVSLYAPWVTQTPWFVWVFSYVPLYVVCVPLFFLLLKRWVPAHSVDAQPQGLSAGSMVKIYVVMMGAVYAFNIVSAVITQMIAMLKGSAVANPLDEVVTSSGLVYNLLFGCIVAPVGEELVFRWALYPRIAPRYGEKLYLLVSSGIFALYHGNLSQLLYAFVVGYLLGLVYVKTQRLRYNIAFHVVINLTGMILGPALAALGAIGIGILLVFELVCFVVGGLLWAKRPDSTRSLRPGTDIVPLYPIRALLKTGGMVALVVLCLLMIITATLA